MLPSASLAARPSWACQAPALAGLLFAGLAAGCRIYRDAPRAEPVAADVADAGGAGGLSDEGSSAREAVSLWVLNRQEAELSPRAAEPPPALRREAAPPEPRPEVLVVLGRGVDLCVEQLAAAGLGALLDGRPPALVVTGLLDELRRHRWSGVDTALHAHLRSSGGRFGAVQAVPASAFSAGMVERAAEVHAIADGRHGRWRVRRAPEPLLPPASATADAGAGLCTESPREDLQGPAGVLLRATSGEYHLGLIGADVLADAGLVPVAAQPSLASAAGPAGAVLLLGDCASVPEASEAPRVYLSSLATGNAPPGTSDECPLSHALLGSGGARVSGAGPLAWAVASARLPPAASAGISPSPPASAPPTPPSSGPSDAGAAPPSAQ